MFSGLLTAFKCKVHCWIKLNIFNYMTLQCAWYVLQGYFSIFFLCRKEVALRIEICVGLSYHLSETNVQLVCLFVDLFNYLFILDSYQIMHVFISDHVKKPHTYMYQSCTILNIYFLETSVSGCVCDTCNLALLSFHLLFI